MQKMNFIRTSQIVVLVTTLALFAPAALAVGINSSCQMRIDNKMTKIESDKNVDKKYPLASISKVVTAAWAVARLGAHYRFQTKFHLTKVNEDTFDLHIEGDLDPIMGKHTAYFITSELNRTTQKINHIRNMTFDEKFIIDWSVEEKSRISGSTPYYDVLKEQTDHVMRTLRDGMATPIVTSDYNDLKSQASDLGIEMAKNPSLKVDDITFLSRADFRARGKSDFTLVYKSAPLYQILKLMNNRSNNYIADHLFWNLGGIESFNDFNERILKMDTADLQFYIGSGNNANYIYGGERGIYNEGSCAAMIRVLFYLDNVLEKSGLNLSDVMAVAGKETRSTVSGWGGSFLGSTIAKTGTVNTAKTLTGAINTKEGAFYFTILLKTEGSHEWGNATGKIKNILGRLIKKYGGPTSFSYSQKTVLPFDKESTLKILSASDTNYDQSLSELNRVGEALP